MFPNRTECERLLGEVCCIACRTVCRTLKSTTSTSYTLRLHHSCRGRNLTWEENRLYGRPLFIATSDPVTTERWRALF